jgi:hypothetical protein
MLVATQAMPVKALPDMSAPQTGTVAAAAPGHGLFDNFFGLFGPSRR